MQRGVAVVVHQVHICARSDQRLSALHLAVAAGKVQRRTTLFILFVRLCARFEELLYCF